MGLCEEIHQWQMLFPQNDQVMRKVFPCHGVIMKRLLGIFVHSLMCGFPRKHHDTTAICHIRPSTKVNSLRLKKSPWRKRFYRMQYQFECFAKALPWWLVFIQNIWKIIQSRCVASCFLLSCFVSQDCIISTYENIWWPLCKGSNSEEY